MIYKLNNGGTVKLQNAGNVPIQQKRGTNVLFVDPRIASQSIIDGIRRIIPKKWLKYVAENVESLGMPLMAPNNFYSPGSTFLLPYDEQEKAMNKIGYHKVHDKNYGLVRTSTANLQKLKPKEIPIYQIGNDDVDKSNIEQIYIGFNGDGAEPFSGIKNGLQQAGGYPYAIYKDKTNNKYYYQAYDLNDYGKHGRKELGTTYGGKQILAEMYDVLGNPFVQRTGLKHISEYDNAELIDNDWPKTIKNEDDKFWNNLHK